MGQKIHPLGLRLGITQEHDSKWITRETFTRWRWLMQDKAIRDFLNTNYKEALLEKIIIRRDQTALDKKSLDPINIVRVWIYAENPQALLKFGKSHSLKVISEKLRLVCTNTKLIDSWAKTPEYKILPRIYQIDSSAHKASGIARNLIEKLENRTPFRRALKRTISELQTRERKKRRPSHKKKRRSQSQRRSQPQNQHQPRRFKKKFSQKKRRSKLERFRFRRRKKYKREFFKAQQIELSRLKNLRLVPRSQKKLNASQSNALKKIFHEKFKMARISRSFLKSPDANANANVNLKTQKSKTALETKQKTSTKTSNLGNQNLVQARDVNFTKVKPDVKNTAKPNAKHLTVGGNFQTKITNVKNTLKLSLKGLALKPRKNLVLKTKKKLVKKPKLNQVFKIKGTVSEVKQFLELKKQELKKDSIKPVIKRRLTRLTPIKLEKKLLQNVNKNNTAVRSPKKMAVKPGLKLGLTATTKTPIQTRLKTIVKAPVNLGLKMVENAFDVRTPAIDFETVKTFIKSPEKANLGPKIKTPVTQNLKLNSGLRNSNNLLKPKTMVKPKKVYTKSESFPGSDLSNFKTSLKPIQPIKSVKPYDVNVEVNAAEQPLTNLGMAFKNTSKSLKLKKPFKVVKLVNPTNPIKPMKLITPLDSLKLGSEKKVNSNFVLKPLLHSKLKTSSQNKDSLGIKLNFKAILKLNLSEFQTKNLENLCISKRFLVSQEQEGLLKPFPKAIKINSTVNSLESFQPYETKVLKPATLKKEMFKTNLLKKIKRKALKTKALTQNTSKSFRKVLKLVKTKAIKKKSLKTKAIKKKVLKNKASQMKTNQTKAVKTNIFKKKKLKKGLGFKNLNLKLAKSSRKAFKRKKRQIKKVLNVFKKKRFQNSQTNLKPNKKEPLKLKGSRLRVEPLKTKALKKTLTSKLALALAPKEDAQTRMSTLVGTNKREQLKKINFKTKGVKTGMKQEKKFQKQTNNLNSKNFVRTRNQQNKKKLKKNVRVSVKKGRSTAPFTERYLCRFTRKGLRRKRPISREERNNRRQKRQKQAVKKQRQRQLSFLQGVRIQLSGRLNGADIARVEWYKQGRVPLQTLRAQIDYVSKAAKTTHGMLGVKVWTFTGEKGSAF